MITGVTLNVRMAYSWGVLWGTNLLWRTMGWALCCSTSTTRRAYEAKRCANDTRKQCQRM